MYKQVQVPLGDAQWHDHMAHVYTNWDARPDSVNSTDRHNLVGQFRPKYLPPFSLMQGLTKPADSSLPTRGQPISTHLVTSIRGPHL